MRASTRAPRRCRRCGTDITDGHHNRQRCEPCARERKLQVDRDLKRRRYGEDPDYRERRREASRASHRRAMTDPERREQRNARQRDRYAEDPDYRARKLASARATYRRGRQS
ncbi:MAG: hypothetical protein OXM87_05745 [Truepera sp.]|nr:hypothetical protein [Truepera sp.]